MVSFYSDSNQVSKKFHACKCFTHNFAILLTINKLQRFEKYIEKKAHESVTELSVQDRDLANVDGDVSELSNCIAAIEDLKLLTAVEAGTRAFKGITSKSQRCHTIFQTLKKFASNLASLTEAFMNLDASAVIHKRKDIYTAIGLGSIMKKFAESCQSLMEKIVHLFQSAAGKLSTLWEALSHAKDVMVDSLREVVDSRSFCEEATKKVGRLRELTGGLEKKSRGVQTLNVETLSVLKNMYKGNEFSDTMDTARGVDDEVGKAVSRMKSAAKRVKDEYHNLPPMITDGIIDSVEDEGNDSDTSKLREIETNIQDLEDATKTVENAKILQATKEIHEELSKIPSKIDICEEMIGSCTDFTDKSKSSIDSFLGKWTLESATDHIQQMRKLASISKIMEQFAIQIQKLLRALIGLLQAMVARVRAVVDQAQNLIGFGSSGGGNAGKVLDSAVDNALDKAEDLVSDGLNSMMGKMFGK